RSVLLPTAAGEAKKIPLPGYRVFSAKFIPPDGKRIGFAGNEPGHGLRGYVLDAVDGKPRPFTPEGLGGGAGPSPDGTRMAGTGPGRRPLIYSLDGSEPRPIPGLEPGDIPIQWSDDGGTLYVSREGQLPRPIYRYSLSSGKKTPWKEVVPADRVGLIFILNMRVTPDGKSYAYTVNRVTSSDLFVVTGWK